MLLGYVLPAGDLVVISADRSVQTAFPVFPYKNYVSVQSFCPCVLSCRQPNLGAINSHFPAYAESGI